jgi:DNA-binding response OmpR family regulator
MNILYLEDSPPDIELLSRYMKIINARLLVATTMELAHRYLLEQDIDVFLVDIVLGNQFSFPLIQTVVEHSLCRYIVAVTARALPSECRHYVEIGCDAVLAKPFTIDNLEDTLKQLTRQTKKSSSHGNGRG